jgi:hypothetical protein
VHILISKVHAFSTCELQEVQTAYARQQRAGMHQLRKEKKKKGKHNSIGPHNNYDALLLSATPSWSLQ